MSEAVKQEVTLAVIGVNLDNLSDKFDVLAEDIKAQAVDFKKENKIMGDRMRVQEDKMLTLEGEQKTSRRITRAISIFLGVVGTYLGIKF